MKISLNWLTDYVDVGMAAGELADLLTRIGWNCEDVIETPSDIIFDIEVTSNRSDCLGHLGIAREVAAATGKAFRPPEIPDLPTSGRADELIAVEVRRPDWCPRYTARVLRGVKVGPSPAWMVERLEQAGLRSINNVVDATNYVLMEYSQPLHSFDFDKLVGGRIVVRPGAAGESILSIDETLCKLDESMLVIADAEKPVAVAGIMGGLNTEVTEATVNVLIEAAQFDPLTIRKASRKLTLMSESNYRFERGVDPVALERASLRACQLIIDTAGGTLAEGIVDVWAKPFSPRTVSLRPQRCNMLLGMDVPVQRQLEILKRLTLEPRVADGQIVCTIPSHRPDLRREADLIEEVGRMYGYDKINVSGWVRHAVTDEGIQQRIRRQVGLLMTAAGFDETITYSFTNSEAAALLGYGDTVSVDASVRKSDNVLRPTLLTGLLRTCKTNQDTGSTDVNLFELASVFRRTDGDLPQEHVELGMITTGDLRDLRGVIELLADRVTPAVTLEITAAPVAALAEAESAEISLDGKRVGAIGLIAPAVRDFYDVERPLCAAWMDFSALVEHSDHRLTYKPLPRFPAVSRDLSLIVDEEVTWRELVGAVADQDQPLREAMEYVTTYRGKQVQPGKQSLTLRLTYRSPSETLRSEQVDEQVAQIVSVMKKKFAAELRG